MINKHDFILVGITLILTFLMIAIYDMTLAKPNTIATVDIKGITDEFLSLATRANLPEEKMNALVSEFTSSLEDGVAQISQDHILLTKRAVVSEEPDLTGELRDYVASRITKRVTK